MVTYGMHTPHQVMLEHREPYPKDDRTLLHRVAYTEGNLVLGIPKIAAARNRTGGWRGIAAMR